MRWLLISTTIVMPCSPTTPALIDLSQLFDVLQIDGRSESLTIVVLYDEEMGCILFNCVSVWSWPDFHFCRREANAFSRFVKRPRASCYSSIRLLSKSLRSSTWAPLGNIVVLEVRPNIWNCMEQKLRLQRLKSIHAFIAYRITSNQGGGGAFVSFSQEHDAIAVDVRF